MIPVAPYTAVLRRNDRRPYRKGPREATYGTATARPVTVVAPYIYGRSRYGTARTPIYRRVRWKWETYLCGISLFAS
jgi:hypothetical protein